MKKVFASILAVIATACILNAGTKYSDLSTDYLENKVSVEVKRIIAQDPQTDRKTLELLFKDKDQTVRGNVVANPSF